ncbi:MAG: S-layer homology domain-containing protein [Peptostreptococcaceae bacterium]
MRKNHNLKRFVVTTLTTSIVSLNIAPIVNANTIKDFADISEKYFAKDHIENLISRGVLEGYPDDTFRPNESITRAEFVKATNRAFNFTEKGTESFKDIDSNAWYFDEILIATNAGYIEGYEDSTFRPNEKITRQEIAKILGILLKVSADGITSFEDDSEISNWAKKYVDGLKNENVLGGYEDNTFKPKENATRGESAKLIRISSDIYDVRNNKVEDEDLSGNNGNSGGTTNPPVNPPIQPPVNPEIPPVNPEIPPVNPEIPEITEDVETEEKLQEVVNNPNVSTINIVKDITLQESLVIPENKNVVIEENVEVKLSNDAFIDTSSNLTIKGSLVTSEFARSNYEEKIITRGNAVIFVDGGNLNLQDMSEIKANVNYNGSSKFKVGNVDHINTSNPNSIFTLRTEGSTLNYSTTNQNEVVVNQNVIMNSTLEDFEVKSGDEHSIIDVRKDVKVNLAGVKDVIPGQYIGTGNGNWELLDELNTQIVSTEEELKSALLDEEIEEIIIINNLTIDKLEIPEGKRVIGSGINLEINELVSDGEVYISSGQLRIITNAIIKDNFYINNSAYLRNYGYLEFGKDIYFNNGYVHNYGVLKVDETINVNMYSYIKNYEDAELILNEILVSRFLDFGIDIYKGSSVTMDNIKHIGYENSIIESENDLEYIINSEESSIVINNAFIKDSLEDFIVKPKNNASSIVIDIKDELELSKLNLYGIENIQNGTYKGLDGEWIFTQNNLNLVSTKEELELALKKPEVSEIIIINDLQLDELVIPKGKIVSFNIKLEVDELICDGEINISSGDLYIKSNGIINGNLYMNSSGYLKNYGTLYISKNVFLNNGYIQNYGKLHINETVDVNMYSYIRNYENSELILNDIVVSRFLNFGLDIYINSSVTMKGIHHIGYEDSIIESNQSIEYQITSEESSILLNNSVIKGYLGDFIVKPNNNAVNIIIDIDDKDDLSKLNLYGIEDAQNGNYISVDGKWVFMNNNLISVSNEQELKLALEDDNITDITITNDLIIDKLIIPTGKNVLFNTKLEVNELISDGEINISSGELRVTSSATINADLNINNSGYIRNYGTLETNKNIHLDNGFINNYGKLISNNNIDVKNYSNIRNYEEAKLSLNKILVDGYTNFNLYIDNNSTLIVDGINHIGGDNPSIETNYNIGYQINSEESLIRVNNVVIKGSLGDFVIAPSIDYSVITIDVDPNELAKIKLQGVDNVQNGTYISRPNGWEVQ